ncbi:kinase-like protein [Rhizopus microsporus var. microsporus]|uniref:non-specific serine/threonine protein kinase n=1 Tax=Rhizopus microsporus var. microsporus TaxID=86635 RepID=A0A1X0RJH5_RHIZD|nr:kinase-like protein [Rhizopus microsporus var. microsporus]
MQTTANNKKLKKKSISDNSTATKATFFKSDSNKRTSNIWRSPGQCCEIPNILGNTYLAPFTVQTDKPKKPKEGPKRPPWIPAGYNWTPSPLPPIIRSDETLFEKRLRKALPKLSIAVSPKSRYIGSKEIGTGVNGAVIQVHVKNNAAQKLALKKCKLSHDKEYRTAIIRELRIMSTGHSHIIKVREVSLYQSDIWIAMDLMRCSVFAVLCVRALPEEYAILVAKETLKALEFLHCKGFIHRDIKCENLLISQNGEIKLADFGLATTKKHLNRERLGTAKWMSPEVIREEFYDEKVDLWSLGITIIEMMDRVPPHYNIKSDEKVFQKILKEPSPTFSFSYPTIYCTGLVAWLLEEDPINRPSATEVIRELNVHLEQGFLKCATNQELVHFLLKNKL